jgi:hypothetical protein
MTGLASKSDRALRELARSASAAEAADQRATKCAARELEKRSCLGYFL